MKALKKMTQSIFKQQKKCPPSNHTGGSLRFFLGVVSVLFFIISGIGNIGAQTIIKNIPINYPIDIVIHPVTNLVYVADDTSPSRIHIIDGSTDAVTGNIVLSSGWNALRGQAIDVANNILYVTHHNLSSGNVSVVDLGTNTKLIPELSAGANSHDAAINPVSNKFYIANANSYNVSVFKLDTRVKLSTIYTGPGRALGVAVNTITNRIYVATEGGNAVRVIDGVTDSVTASIGTGYNVNDVAVHEGLDRVYASNRGSSSVSVIDAAANSVIATINVPSGPRGMDINPATGRLYVACTSGYLAIIDVSGNTVAATIYTGSNAHDTEVNRRTGKVYVANLNGGTVTVIQDIAVPSNQSPVADAGPDQTVHPGDLVTLDGSGSYDPDENYPLGYDWTLTQKPVDSQAFISNPDQVNPTITIDEPGDYIITLAVTDNLGASGTPSQVHISTTNSSPLANAGPDQAVTRIGQTVTLDGTQSWDPDGDPITYRWLIIQKPLGSSVSLDDPTAPSPVFVPDIYGDYIIQLLVSDPWTSSGPDQMTVSFENIKPVADAGNNTSCLVGDTVSLDGSSSYDANGDSLNYNWQIVSKPSGSSAQFNDSTQVNPTLQPDLPGEYVINLIVNDGFLDSDPDNIVIAVISVQDAAKHVLQDLSGIILQLPDAVFKNKNMGNTLVKKINEVLLKIDQAEYREAINQLKNDILKKTDGCAQSDSPDKNDWIINCESQAVVYNLIIEALDLLADLQ